MEGFFVAIIGLVMGSFIGAFTYRWPREIKISKGRSFCPQCGQTIFWYDNIPLLSFVLLGGKCRNCEKKISFREPIIEALTAFVFFVIWYRSEQILSMFSWLDVSVFGTLILLLISSAMVAVLVIDWEHQLIPDEAVYLVLGLMLLVLLGGRYDLLFVNLIAGLGLGAFLLVVHVLTRGNGMGLGDVKLAVASGAVLGPIYGVIWMFLAFVIGSIVGILLILIGKAKLGSKIAFGPFLVLSFILVLCFGKIIQDVIFGI
jgi:leader peptidase (prepilin peptidase) / N-methyltransferase